MTTAIKMIIAPTKSVDPEYDDVPTIRIPLIIAITIDTRYFCIIFTVSRTVTNIEKLVTIIITNCHKFGTIVWVAGKNIGKHMLAKKMN